MHSSLSRQQSSHCRLHICWCSATKKASCFSSAEKKRVAVDQPKVVQLYNYGTGCTDGFDQNLACYMIQHRSKKWYWPIFTFCIDTAVQNAFQLHRLQEKCLGAPVHDLLSFWREIVQVYVKTLSCVHMSVPYPPACIPADHRVLTKVRTDDTGHWIVQGTQRRCVAVTNVTCVVMLLEWIFQRQL